MFAMGPAFFKQAGASAAVSQTVWSAVNKSSDIILSSGNIDAESNSPSGGGTVLSVSSKTSGKYYAEFEIVGIYSVTPGSGFGIHTGTSTLANFLGQDVNGIGAWSQNDDVARVFQNNLAFAVQESMPGVVGYRGRLAFDASTGKLWLAYFSLSTTSWAGNAGGDPGAGTIPLTTLALGTPFYLACCPRRGDTSNAGNRNKIRLVDPSQWRWPAPTGFVAWT